MTRGSVSTMKGTTSMTALQSSAKDALQRLLAITTRIISLLVRTRSAEDMLIA